MNRERIVLTKSMGRAFALFMVLVFALQLMAVPVQSVYAAKKPALSHSTLKLQPGQTKKLKVKNYKGKITWKSNKPKVVSVNKKGRLKAEKQGKAKIIARTDKGRLVCLVQVKKASTTAGSDKTEGDEGEGSSQTGNDQTQDGNGSGNSDGQGALTSPAPDDGQGENQQQTGGTEETFPHGPYDDGTIRDGLTAMQCVKEMGVGINLGNTFEAYWQDTSNKTTGAQTIGSNTPADYETCWGAVQTTQECIDGMKNAGFRTVRVPVYWGNMMKDDGGYQINTDYLARVGQVIDYCRKNQLYVVINIHHYDEFLIKNKSKEKVLEITEKLWRQIAEYYKGYSDYLIFEGFNENLGSSREKDDFSQAQIYDYVNEMNQCFVDTVRATGGNNAKRILIASGYWTNIDKTTDKRFKMPTDSAKDKMMVSVHYIDNACFWTKQVGGDYWLDYSKAQCELLKQAFMDKGIPVFVGECTGAYGKDNIASDAQYTKSEECLSLLLNMAVDYGFIPVLWDVNDGFYSRTDCKIKVPANQEVITSVANKIAQG